MAVVVIVCGDRNYTEVAELFRTLDRIDEVEKIGFVVDGASDDVTGPYIGADYWAHQWAKARGKQCVRVHANWKKEGRAAGPIRNKKMLDRYQPHLVVYFPGGAGTTDMVNQAKKAGVLTIPAFNWMKKR